MSSNHEFWQEIPSPLTRPIEASGAEEHHGPPPDPSPPGMQRMRWFELLLDPVSLQRMMLCGGGLLILGFVVWLWSCGIFENPVVLAWSVGLTNLAIIGTGITLVTRTRYQLSGQGLALLGSIALPLNLWLYDAQKLISLSAGGHLWVPALICCLIYAGIARVLRNPYFVYTLVGGVVLTGLLLLADMSVNRFWELLPVSTLLITIGSLARIAANFFPDAGDFSQERFGRAARWSGLCVLCVGLSILGGGQLIGLMAESRLVKASFLGELATTLVMNPFQKWWTLGLTCTALGLSTAEWFTQRKWMNLGALIFFAVWSCANLLVALEVQLTIQAFTIGLSILAIGLNVTQSLAKTSVDGETRAIPRDQLVLSLLSWGLAVWAVLRFALDLNFNLNTLTAQNTSLWTAVQLFLAGMACWTSDRIWTVTRANDRVLVPVYLGAVSISLGTMAVLAHTAFNSLPLVLVGPTCLALAIGMVGFWTDYRAISSLRHASLGAIFTIILACVWAYPANVALFAQAKGIWIGLAVANAVVSGWQTHFQRSSVASVCFNLLLGFIAAESLSLTTLNFDYSMLLALTSIGFLNQLFLQFPGGTTETEQRSAIGGNLMALSGGLGSILLSLTELASGAAAFKLAGLLLLQGTLHGSLGLLGRESAWRQTFRIVAGGCFACMLLIFASVSDLNPAQKIELFALAAGLLVLGLCHVGLSREQASGTRHEAVSVGLWLGALLTVIPALLGLFAYRVAADYSPAWLYGHELGVLLLGLALFGVGSLTQTRATTLVGGGTLGLYVASLLFLVRWPEQLQNTSVLMMLFGGLFFGLAILLSVYRDRLVQLPGKIKEGKGVYSVFKWR